MSKPDVIATLPVDQTTPTQAEAYIVDTFFKEQKTVNKFLDGIKDVIIIALLFLLVSLPQVNDLICKHVDICASSPYMLLLGKTVLFALLYFLVNNLYLARKKN